MKKEPTASNRKTMAYSSAEAHPAAACLSKKSGPWNVVSGFDRRLDFISIV